MSDSTPTQHDIDTQRGVTTFWALALLGMFGLAGWLAAGYAANEGIISEIDALATGSINAIGFVAIGGMNAIGVLSLGMINSIGVISVGGINSIGIVSIGGFNSLGVISIGGVNSSRFLFGVLIATVFVWDPRIAHNRLSR